MVVDGFPSGAMGRKLESITNHEFTPSLLLENYLSISLCRNRVAGLTLPYRGLSRDDSGSDGVMRERGSFWGQDMFGVLRRIG